MSRSELWFPRDTNRWILAAVGIGIAAAVLLRVVPLVAGFPLDDGGLFWIMANELRDNGFVPPVVTAYNGSGIPWMYPPLGLLLLALVGGGIEWLRILPVVFAILTLPAMWLLARSLVGRRAALFATVAFGLAPASFAELLAGGGVARAPGMVLALLTMWAVVREKPVPAGVLAGLTLLTHPLAAAYAGVGSAVLWLVRSRRPSMLVAAAVALGIGLLWFGPMAARHGVESVLAAFASRSAPDLGNAAVLFARLALYPPNLAVAVGVIGAVIAYRTRRWDLLAWLVVTALGVGASGRWTVVPLSVLAGMALVFAVDRWPRRASVGIVALAVGTGLLGLLSPDVGTTLTSSERATMAWVRDHTRTDATVAVIGYPADGGFVEWFPVFSERHNETTAQGSEWLETGDRWDEAWAAARCRELSCLPAADYYVLMPGCCRELERDLREMGPGVFEQSEAGGS